LGAASIFACKLPGGPKYPNTGQIFTCKPNNPSTQQFISGYLTLRASRETRNLINVQPSKKF
jgi:hypothetical protein